MPASARRSSDDREQWPTHMTHGMINLMFRSVIYDLNNEKFHVSRINRIPVS